MDEFDQPWKEVSERYFPQMLQFYHPKAYEAIDWQQPWTAIDKELPKTVPEALSGDRCADKLFRVHFKSGDNQLVFIHVEFQNQRIPDLPRRMYTYYYRIFDRYQDDVLSIAVLGDRHANYRPNCYNRSVLDLDLSFRYPVIKLLDYLPRLDDLLVDDNPFAIVTAAHLIAQQTQHRPETRLQQKLRITKCLYNKGFAKDDVIALFRFIDWVLKLPSDLVDLFREDLAVFEGEQNMPYITSIEELGFRRGQLLGLETGREEGRQEGRQETEAKNRATVADTLLLLLHQRFGTLPEDIRLKIDQANLLTLCFWTSQTSVATTLDEVFKDS